MHDNTEFMLRDDNDTADGHVEGTGTAISRFERPLVTRRRSAGMLAATMLPPWTTRAAAGSMIGGPAIPEASPAKSYPLYEEATASVLPPAGYPSRIALNDSIVRLVRRGVLDRDKFLALRRQAGKTTDEFDDLLSEPSERPILLTRQNAGDYVNLLWPVGLANHIEGNADSPLFTVRLPTFASTAGWTLGKKEEGSPYFNGFPIVRMTTTEEALAIQVAKSIFRPCCDNSTFYQDCNHGSALFGLLQLGASQGLGEADLYREALAFNSFWFPDYYVRTALYFKIARKQAWNEVDPKEIMGKEFSALSSWQRNVQPALVAIPNLIPSPEGGANCGVSVHGATLYRG